MYKIDKPKGRKSGVSMYDKIEFCHKAISKDPTRDFLCGLYYNKDTKTLVGLDGRRMHIANNLELPLETGIYKTQKTANMILFVSTIDGKFPNYEKCIPEYPPSSLWIFWSITNEKNKLTSFIFEVYSKNIRINLDYLMDLKSILRSDPWSMAYNQENPSDKAVIFKNDSESLTAVIMPLSDD